MRNTADSLAKIQTEQKKRELQQKSTPTPKPKLPPVPKELRRNIDDMSAADLKEHIARMQRRLQNMEQGTSKPKRILCALCRRNVFHFPARAPTASQRYYDEDNSEDSMDSFIDDSEMTAVGSDERAELKRTLKVRKKVQIKISLFASCRTCIDTTALNMLTGTIVTMTVRWRCDASEMSTRKTDALLERRAWRRPRKKRKDVYEPCVENTVILLLRFVLCPCDTFVCGRYQTSLETHCADLHKVRDSDSLQRSINHF